MFLTLFVANLDSRSKSGLGTEKDIGEVLDSSGSESSGEGGEKVNPVEGGERDWE